MIITMEIHTSGAKGSDVVGNIRLHANPHLCSVLFEKKVDCKIHVSRAQRYGSGLMMQTIEINLEHASEKDKTLVALSLNSNEQITHT